MKWFDDAACKSADPELFSPTGTPIERRRKTRYVVGKFCDHCPVRQACLDDALRSERGLIRASMDTIRGGLDVADRAALLHTERAAS